MTEWQKCLNKDRDAFDKTKKEKRNNVEIWAHAIKQEEKKNLLTYCDKHGNEAVEQIQKAIEERHAKELATKE